LQWRMGPTSLTWISELLHFEKVMGGKQRQRQTTNIISLSSPFCPIVDIPVRSFSFKVFWLVKRKEKYIIKCDKLIKRTCHTSKVTLMYSTGNGFTYISACATPKSYWKEKKTSPPSHWKYCGNPNFFSFSVFPLLFHPRVLWLVAFVFLYDWASLLRNTAFSLWVRKENQTGIFYKCFFFSLSLSLSKHGLMKLSNTGEMTPKSVLWLHHLAVF